MILDNLSAIFSRLYFLDDHYPFQEKISFSVFNGCINIEFAIDGPPRSRRRDPYELEEQVNQYEMYSIVRVILNYLHIDTQRFYKMNCSTSKRSVKFEIFLSAEWLVGYAYSPNESELNMDLPNPAGREYVEKARSNNIPLNFKFDLPDLPYIEVNANRWNYNTVSSFIDSISSSFTQI